jgi:hypothetical protein
MFKRPKKNAATDLIYNPKEDLREKKTEKILKKRLRLLADS